VGLHHVELWVADLDSAAPRWGWLLERLGWTPYQDWDRGRSWRSDETYVVLEQSAALLSGAGHDRMRPGLNHLALHAPDMAAVDEIAAAGPDRGWSLMFPDRHPHAGGSGHYAAYLEDGDGFEVEVVARA
jgi:catechol 2,3-dioxygenase-like lactoylglutathione lyase family enzyme